MAPFPIFCRCRHFSVGGASGRGGVDSRGQGMASEEFGPCPNSLAQTHQPRGGHTALFSGSGQGETKCSDIVAILSHSSIFYWHTQDFSSRSVVMNCIAVLPEGDVFCGEAWLTATICSLPERDHPSWQFLAHLEGIGLSAGRALTWQNKL